MSGYVRGPGVQHWHSIDTVNSGLLTPQTSTASTIAWPTADLAIYCPVIVRQQVIVKKLWFSSASIFTGNYDLGLYDAAGVALLRRGSTAKPGAGEIVWDCIDTTIGPGIYYVALVSSNNTDTFGMATLAAPNLAALGYFTEAGALPLPATATFAVPQTLGSAPLVGMLLNDVVS
jgi:hypothetical protein